MIEGPATFAKRCIVAPRLRSSRSPLGPNKEQVVVGNCVNTTFGLIIA